MSERPKTRRKRGGGGAAGKNQAATPVIDGKTGKIKTDVDGKAAVIDQTKPPTQQALIEVPLEQLIHDYNKLASIKDAIDSKAGYWRQKSKEYGERIEPLLAEIRRRDDEKNDPQQSFAGIHSAVKKLENQEPKGGEE